MSSMLCSVALSPGCKEILGWELVWYFEIGTCSVVGWLGTYCVAQVGL